jgi:hypothetical protein
MADLQQKREAAQETLNDMIEGMGWRRRCRKIR